MDCLLGAKLINYAKAKNINLLRDDRNFILDCLRTIPLNEHKSILRNYFGIWISTLRVVEDKVSKDNIARFKANSFLRDFMDNK